MKTAVRMDVFDNFSNILTTNHGNQNKILGQMSAFCESTRNLHIHCMTAAAAYIILIFIERQFVNTAAHEIDL